MFSWIMLLDLSQCIFSKSLLIIFIVIKDINGQISVLENIEVTIRKSEAVVVIQNKRQGLIPVLND